MRRWVRLGVLLLVVGGAVGYHLLAGSRSGPAPAGDALDLRAWDLVGCWEVHLTGWRATPRADPPAADTAAGRPSSPVGASPAPRDGDRARPESLEPPGRVMLLADSVDLWGRVLGSYRAVALDADAPARAPVGEAARSARSLRWLTARDTLWLIWREEGTRAGVALTRHDGHLRGAARALSGAADLSAGAEAWPVNCATGAVETRPAWRSR